MPQVLLISYFSTSFVSSLQNAAGWYSVTMASSADTTKLLLLVTQLESHIIPWSWQISKAQRPFRTKHHVLNYFSRHTHAPKHAVPPWHMSTFLIYGKSPLVANGAASHMRIKFVRRVFAVSMCPGTLQPQSLFWFHFLHCLQLAAREFAAKASTFLVRNL